MAWTSAIACVRTRAWPDVPVIMLTARVEETDRLIGLELGADDYVTKPFSPRELVARVRAVLRRARGHGPPPGIVRVGEPAVDLTKRSVTVGGRPVSLTPTEFELLAVMAHNPGRPFARAQPMDLVYDVAYTGYDRAIDSHIKNLRRKGVADRRRIAQVLGNLLTNALRHTPSSGRVTLSAAIDAPLQGGMMRVTVTDTGPGIPPEDMPYIFERFWPGEKSRSRAGGGAGLGLAIAKHLIQAHGGEIGVESPSGVGKGTTFYFTLPLSPAT